MDNIYYKTSFWGVLINPKCKQAGINHPQQPALRAPSTCAKAGGSHKAPTDPEQPTGGQHEQAWQEQRAMLGGALPNPTRECEGSVVSSELWSFQTDAPGLSSRRGPHVRRRCWSGIKTEKEWCFRLIQPAHKSRQKSRCRSLCCLPCLPLSQVTGLALCCSGVIALLTYLDTILLLNTCHSVRHRFAISLWLPE